MLKNILTGSTANAHCFLKRGVDQNHFMALFHVQVLFKKLKRDVVSVVRALTSEFLQAAEQAGQY